MRKAVTAEMKSEEAEGSLKRTGFHPKTSPVPGSSLRRSLLNWAVMIESSWLRVSALGTKTRGFNGAGKRHLVLLSWSTVCSATPLPTRMEKALETCPFFNFFKTCWRRVDGLTGVTELGDFEWSRSLVGPKRRSTVAWKMLSGEGSSTALSTLLTIS